MTNLVNLFHDKGKNVPVWFMRQAGRYLPEYLRIRGKAADFLDLCYDYKKACEITLQPIRRFDLDAAIIFSDILVLPNMLGWKVQFNKGEGPILQKFTSSEDFKYLNNQFDKKINNIYEAIARVRAKLPKQISLIGFAGSPWTVASYMLEGRGKQDFSVSKSFLYNNYFSALKLIDFITEKTIEHLTNQVEAGAEIVQLFDSWSGILSGKEYNDFVINPTARIVEGLKNKFPDLPIIGFPRGSGFLYDHYIEKTGISCIGVDQFVPLSIMRKWQDKIIVQGNLDPVVLLSSKETIKEKVEDIFATLIKKNFIFNLGHGILPLTDFKKVEYLISCIKENYE